MTPSCSVRPSEPAAVDLAAELRLGAFASGSAPWMRNGVVARRYGESRRRPGLRFQAAAIEHGRAVDILRRSRSVRY